MTSAHSSDDVRIFRKECTSLAKAGYDVWLVARGESREEHGVHVIGAGAPPTGRLKRMTAFTKRVYQTALSLDAEVYHLHDPELLPYAAKLKQRGKKVIFDSHENTAAQIRSKHYLPFPIREFSAKLYKKYETHTVRKIDAVVVPCTFNGINIFEGRAKRTYIVPNYPTLSDFYDKYDSARLREKKICYIGGLTSSRGITCLIQAAYQAGVKLVLAGTFSSKGYRHQLEQMPEYSGVEYLGNVPNTAVAGILQSVSVGMNTLLNVGQYYHIDTFGVKVYEYMALGLPVILSDTPFAKQMNEKYGFGICVDPANSDAIADAIRFLIDNPDTAREMGRNGRRAIEQEFNWGTQEKKLLELYGEIVR